MFKYMCLCVRVIVDRCLCLLRWSGSSTVYRVDSPTGGKKGKKGSHTHRHKMGGARFDMSAPDIGDKPERVPTNQVADQDERSLELCTIPNKVADRVADE